MSQHLLGKKTSRTRHAPFKRAKHSNSQLVFGLAALTLLVAALYFNTFLPLPSSKSLTSSASLQRSREIFAAAPRKKAGPPKPTTTTSGSTTGTTSTGGGTTSTGTGTGTSSTGTGTTSTGTGTTGTGTGTTSTGGGTRLPPAPHHDPPAPVGVTDLCNPTTLQQQGLNVNAIFPLIPDIIRGNPDDPNQRDKVCSPAFWNLAIFTILAWKVLALLNWLAAVSAIILTMWAGLNYFQGNDAAAKNSKAWLITVYTGLLIVIFARIILYGSIAAITNSAVDPNAPTGGQSIFSGLNGIGL